MIIVYSNTPQNNSRTFNTPLFQDWGPLPNPHYTELYYFPMALGSVIVPPTISFFIKDVIGVPDYSVYSEFRLFAGQSYGSNNPSNWVNPSSYIGQGYPNGGGVSIPITSTGINFSFTPVLQNLPLLPFGNYTFRSAFYIEGRRPDGTWVNMAAYLHFLKLSVVAQSVQVSPSNHLFQHTQGGLLPSYQYNIYSAVPFTIIGNPRVVLSSASSGTTINTITDAAGTYQTISCLANGTGYFTVTLGDYYDSIGTFDPSVLIQRLNVMTANTIAAFVDFSIQIFTAPTLVAEPDELNFVSTKGVAEAESQNIFFQCNQAYIISSSIWLSTYEAIITQNGVTSNVVVVTPISTANMAVGNYVGFVQIETTIAGFPFIKNILINYSIQDFLQSPYLQGQYAFTLDNKYFLLSSSNQDTFIQIDIIIKTYNFFTNALKSFNIPQKIVLFKGKSKIYLGKTIHNLMDNFDAPNESFFQYRPALLQITCTEKLLANDTIVRSVTSEEIPFIAGLSKGVENFGILDFNHKANRVTKNSFAYINMILPKGNFELQIERNGIQAETFSLTSDETILTKNIDFIYYNQGDVIDASIVYVAPGSAAAAAKTFKKRYIVFPPGKYSNSITWENEFLLQSALECTGAYKFASELDFQSQDLYMNLVEILEHLQVTKKTKFTINTGWLLKTDIDTVESLMMCKRAWLEKNYSNIEIRPIGKTILNEDSERELIEYTLEFQINPSYAKETYSL